MTNQKILSEFKEFCKQNVLQDLARFEKERKQVLVAVIISSFIFLFFIDFLNQLFFHNIPDIEGDIYISIGAFSVTFSSFWFTRLFFLLIYLILFLGLFIIWSIFYNSAFESFATGFETKTNQKIFEFINNHKNLNLSTKPFDTDVNETLYYLNQSQIFNSFVKINNIKQYSQISGDINNITINITKVDIQLGLNHRWTEVFDINTDIYQASSKNVTSLEEIITLLNALLFFIPTILLLILRLIKGLPYVFKRVAQGKNIDYERFELEVLKNQASNHNIFRGLLFRAKFNKFAKFITVVRPNVLKANISTISHGNKQLIKLEDPEFTEYFTVYSEDQVDARYVLSTSLMEKLVNFRQKASKNIYVSFVDDTIYFAIEYPDGLFEPNLYRSMLRFAPLREYFEAIQLMLGLVEELNLDRQIWKTNE
ncbi:putative Galanin [Calothrix sp. NIES-4071]|nr:putative Galanin [Calothrix sp. NIES-4071]BAZ63875.1 putative Galanin [Calothrix sp. NIES-4105]